MDCETETCSVGLVLCESDFSYYVYIELDTEKKNFANEK